ncbi:MAG: M16 family metallopeptidase [Bacillota bacterium]
MPQYMPKRQKFKRMLLLVAAVFALRMLTLPAVSGQDLDASLLRPYTKVKLDNGLTVIVKEVHSTPIVAVDIWVGTGAKNENPGEAGISHFFEHMLFKGTVKRGMGEIAREIKAVGGYLNAVTSLDTTHYYVVVPSEKIGLALDVAADALLHSTFDPAEIERERKVILEEKRLKEDNPQGKLGLMAYQAAFKGTPYANDVLGTTETLAGINRAAFLDYYQRYYHPENIVLVIVGAVDTQRVIDQARRLFKDFKAQNTAKPAEFPLPKLNDVLKVEAGMPVDQTYLYFGFPGPGISDADEPSLSVLGVILGGGQGSRLYQDLLERKRLVNEIAAGYQSFQRIGMLAIYARTKDTEIRVLESELQAEIIRIIEEGISQAELTRAKAVLRSDIAYAMESDADIAAIIGEYQVDGDIVDAEKALERLSKVTVADIQRVAKEYLNPKGYVLAVVKPQEVKAE